VKIICIVAYTDEPGMSVIARHLHLQAPDAEARAVFSDMTDVWYDELESSYDIVAGNYRHASAVCIAAVVFFFCFYSFFQRLIFEVAQSSIVSKYFDTCSVVAKIIKLGQKFGGPSPKKKIGGPKTSKLCMF